MSKTTRRGSTLVTLALLAAGAGGCRAKGEGRGPRLARPRRPPPTSPAGCRPTSSGAATCASAGRAGPSTCPRARASAADAVQLPVLERLGLVTSTVLAERRAGVATPFNMRRYRLTAEGRKHYIDRETRLPVAPDDPHAGGARTSASCR